MTILLAPMEGLLDFTAARHADARSAASTAACRSSSASPTRCCPTGCSRASCPSCCTAAARRPGVPVRAQLLGSDPACLADNAARLAALGPGRHRPELRLPGQGGQPPWRRRVAAGRARSCWPRIVEAVRRAVPAAHAGVGQDAPRASTTTRARSSARRRSAGGGASELVVHARTKADGYRPPAYWERIADDPRAR